MTTLLERFRGFVEEHQLLEPGVTIVVGYSGGADSGALARLLLEYGARPIAAHLNHGLRPLSHWDEELARSVAARLGIPFVSERTDIEALARRRGVSIEEAGRQARYDFLSRVAEEHGATGIATAHTLDDHVETALLHLARGTGRRGLGGIPIRRGNVIRPLLFARRRETREYCLRKGIPWVEDPSNVDESYARVRARLELLPAFESLHEEAMRNASRAMEILREEDLYLESLAKELLISAAIPANDLLAPLFAGVYERYRVEALLAAPLAIRRRAIVHLIRRFGASPRWDLVDATLTAIEGRLSGAVNPSAEVSLYRRGEALVVKRTSAPEPLCQPWDLERAVGGPNWVMKVCEVALDPCSGIGCSVRAEGLASPVRVRYLSQEDRLDRGAESLSPWRALKKRGVPLAVRQRVPILEDARGLVWVPTVGVADWASAKPTGNAKQIVLEVVRESSEGILGD